MPRFLAPLALGAVAAILLGGLSLAVQTPAAADARVIPAPALDEPPNPAGSETIVLAGGCFWGVQGVFEHVDGVTRAVSGYAGGEAGTAHYEMVSNGDTGHAESVEITFDPRKVSTGKLLQIYFSVAHNPTELNRQGPDSGSQYRSAIFPTSAEQARVAEAYIDQLNAAHAFDATIVTTIEPGRTFYPAEGYHQDFLALNPTHPYIVFNDLPKVDDLKQLFPGLYRDDPVLVLATAPGN
jgi:peptide-methionine (S)-S-oxide reductase